MFGRKPRNVSRRTVLRGAKRVQIGDRRDLAYRLAQAVGKEIIATG